LVALVISNYTLYPYISNFLPMRKKSLCLFLPIYRIVAKGNSTSLPYTLENIFLCRIILYPYSLRRRHFNTFSYFSISANVRQRLFSWSKITLAHAD